MAVRILHVLDATSPPDAVEILAQVLAEMPGEHRVVALGHRSTADLAAAAGISAEQHPMTFLHSMGWADPTGWRGLGRMVREFSPTHVHAWGLPAAFATVMTAFKGERLVTLVDLPRTWHMQLLTSIHKGGVTATKRPCRWIVTSTWLKRVLHGHSIGADAVVLMRPAISGRMPETRYSPAAIREDLGIPPGDGPIVVLGGDGGVGTNGAMLARPGVDPMPHGGRGGPRHDLGLWSTAILRQIFPRLRTVVREDPRALVDHGLERLMNNLPEEDILVIAPATYTWQMLLLIADVMLVTPDGPFAAGCIAHALAAGVPVVGTPVDAVKEYIIHQQNGILAASNRPREIAAAIEAFLSQPAYRTQFAASAPEPVTPAGGFEAIYNGNSERPAWAAA